MDSSRNLKSMSNLFNLELTKLVPLDLSHVLRSNSQQTQSAAATLRSDQY
jgi:hypothetical protein